MQTVTSGAKNVYISTNYDLPMPASVAVSELSWYNNPELCPQRTVMYFIMERKREQYGGFTRKALLSE